jgi:pilus assembly protein CpaC
MKKGIFLFIIFSLIFSNFIFAEGIEEELTLYVGEVKVFSVDTPTRIAIGKPEVVDVTSAKEKEIELVAKSAGTTNFIFWDKWGEHAFRIHVFAEDLGPIQERIDNFIKELNLKKVYTKPIESEGKIMLLGEVRTFEDKERLLSALGPLKEKIIDLIKVREEKLVEIDVQVLELTKEASESLGFSWPGNLTITEQNYPTGASPTKFSTLFRVEYFSRSNFLWTIDFLQRQRKLNVLSRPRLVCLSGKEAELLVGGEVPTFTATVSSTGTTTGEVEYKEFGIKLKIRPTVTENDKIQLSLNTEVSEIGSVESTTYARAYPLTKRTASTELYLDDGETIAIGGLIKQKSDVNIQKVPWLAEIPVLGLFFRHKSISESTPQQDTELFITITPTIIKGKEVSLEKLEEKKPAVEIKPIEETGLLPQELKNYISAVQSKISKYIQYPVEAKGTGWYGTTKLGIFITSEGKIKDIEVVQSSGYNLLDEAAKSAIKKASPFPPFPKELKLKELRIEIPITYHQS